MTRRDLVVVLGALVLAIAASTLLYVGAMATDPGPTATAGELRLVRPRIYFDFRNAPPPPRTVADAQQRVGPLAAIVPFQRNVSDGARDAAGFLLLIIVTATTLVVANDRVAAAYRASLGGWRSQLRVLLTGLAVLGLGFSATALAWVVYLGYVATNARGAPFGVPAALQVGLAAFGVILVFLAAVLAIGFSAAAWRLGDALFRVRPLARFAPGIPSPAIALVGATILFVAWQIPAIGGVLLLAVIAYALGAVVSARLATGGVNA